MSIFDRLFRRPTAAKAATAPFAPAWGWLPALWPAISFERLSSEGYKANAAVFACVSALAMAYPEPPLHIIEADTRSPLPDHPLLPLLRRPNPVMSEGELKQILTIYKAIGGNAYVHLVRDGAGQPVELWPYHVAQMRPKPSRYTWVEEYEYNDGSGEWRGVPAADVIHLKWPSVDPDAPWRALSPIEAMARDVDTDSEASRYIYTILKNDAIPRIAITLPEGRTLTSTQFDRLRAQWEERHGGTNRGKPAVLEGGAGIHRLALDLEELALDALRAIPETRIAAAFRVPAIIAGLLVGLQHATYANYAEARRSFTEQTLVPMWTADAGEISEALTRSDPRIQIAYDTSAVAALQENTDGVYARAIDAWDAGLITRNEARQMLGFPRVEEIVIPPGAPALPPGDTFSDRTQPAAPVFPPMIDVTPEQRSGRAPRSRKARDDDRLSRIERQMQRSLERYLSAQYAVAAAAVEEGQR